MLKMTEMIFIYEINITVVYAIVRACVSTNITVDTSDINYQQLVYPAVISTTNSCSIHYNS